MAKATELADCGEAGAVAAMMALLLGMRASEIVSRVVRDLDDDGRQLWIPDSKTDAGKRTLRVPDVLHPYLQRLVSNQKPDAHLFGKHWRDWPREWVQRICKGQAYFGPMRFESSFIFAPTWGPGDSRNAWLRAVLARVGAVPSRNLIVR
jgi:integrase